MTAINMVSGIVEIEDLCNKTKGKVDIPDSPDVTPATIVISTYLKSGAKHVPKEPTKPKNRTIPYYFGDGGCHCTQHARLKAMTFLGRHRRD